MNRFGFSLFVAIVAISTATSRGEIVMTGGGADLTFYYNSGNNTFDIVLQTKGNTIASGSGLDNVYLGPPGGVGGSASNRVFSSLTLDISDANLGMLNTTPFFTIGPANQAAAGRPDLGIRTRFRENATTGTGVSFVIDQFASTSLSLDWAGSTRPSGAQFALWQTDSFGAPTVFIDTAADDLDFSFPAFGHQHFVYGFSQEGEYQLKFDVQGVGGFFGPNSSVGSVLVNFNVAAVPEPATAGLIAAGFGCIAVGARYRRRQGSSAADGDGPATDWE